MQIEWYNYLNTLLTKFQSKTHLSSPDSITIYRQTLDGKFFVRALTNEISSDHLTGYIVNKLVNTLLTFNFKFSYQANP